MIRPKARHARQFHVGAVRELDLASQYVNAEIATLVSASSTDWHFDLLHHHREHALQRIYKAIDLASGREGLWQGRAKDVCNRPRNAEQSQRSNASLGASHQVL